MFNELMTPLPSQAPPKEGDLYKEIVVEGKCFRLHYGYYEEFERNAPFSEPIPIYPDFIREPHYTEKGQPLVTAMQDVCRGYRGKKEGDSCSDCLYFQKSEELFGLCANPSKQMSKKKSGTDPNQSDSEERT